jgi:hypothetical protein
VPSLGSGQAALRRPPRARHFLRRSDGAGTHRMGSPPRLGAGQCPRRIGAGQLSRPEYGRKGVG